MAEETSIPLVVPPLGESITEAVVAVWLVPVGAFVAAEAPVVELETDKITVQLPAPAAGVLVEQSAAVGDTVHPGDVVGRMQAKDAPEAAEAAAVEVAAVEAEISSTRAQAPPTVDEEALRRATPAQRRALRLGEVAARPSPAPARASAPAPASPGAPAAPSANEDVVPMSPLRKRIAARLVQAQHESASLTTFNEVDMSAVMELRARHKDAFVGEHGVKLGFMSFFVKACAAAARLFPGLNAEMREDAIAYKKRYDFGVAVSTDRGLVVPVLRAVDRMSFADIERGILEVADKARAGKLTLDDLTGGTFTITNGGIFGSMLSTPLLNYPQTGILGMHNIVRRPVAVGDRVEVRPIMYIALTYDHRVVDGREAVQFLVAVKERIESPERLMFGL